jgi:hypothetical protein
MQRLTPDPVPAPLTFEAFKHRQQQFNQRDWDDARKEALAGYTRSFLIIAPMHARTVDSPLTEDDEYGLVGLYYQFPQNKWTCGVWRPSGVHVFCQDSPEAYETGEPLRPETPLRVEFGEALELQGYTLKATTPAGSGVYRAGGTLPITLFWEVLRETDTRYRMFLHLCRDCDTPPAAALDGPPLEGYLPTNVWTLHNPVHDERAVPLPADLPPGRYTLLLGVYPAGNPAEEARLSVQGGETLAGERLVLDTVEIVAP